MERTLHHLELVLLLKLIMDGYVKNTKFTVLDMFHNFCFWFFIFSHFLEGDKP
jgi:hypothetical protein